MLNDHGLSGSVNVVFDALHGNLDLTDAHAQFAGQLERIASSPFLKRLQRLKQLGFVSQNFLAAQHNRYSHALGTVHVMQQLLRKVESSRIFDRAIPSVRQLTDDSRYEAKNKATAAAIAESW